MKKGMFSSCGEEPVPQRSEGMGLEPAYPLRVQVGTSNIILRRGWVSSQQLISPPMQRMLSLLPDLIKLLLVV